jgi:WD40 repeat protein
VRLRHAGRVFALAFSPDGKKLAVENGEHNARHGFGWGRRGQGAIHIWDTTTGKLIRRLTADHQGFLALAYAADGKLLWIGRTAAKSFDPATGKEADVPVGPGPANSAALSPDGKMVALGSKNTVRLVDVRDGKEVRKLVFTAKYSSCLAFSPDGMTLTFATYGGEEGDHGLCLWDVTTGRLRRKLPPESAGVYAFGPDGNTAATASWSQPAVRLWDVGTGKLLRTFEGPTLARYVAFLQDGKALLAGGDDGVWLWDVATGKELRWFGQLPLPSYTAALAPNGKTLALGDGRAVRLFDTASGKELLTVAEPVGDVEAVAFSPDGKVALTGADGVALWDPATGKQHAVLGPVSPVGAAAFSPDGKWVLAGFTKDQELRLWETATRKEVRRFEGQPGKVDFVSFLGDGKSAVSLSAWRSPKKGTLQGDCALRVWDLATGKETRQIGKPGLPCATSVDGLRLAAGGSQIFVWDALTSRKPVELGKPSDGAFALALTPDGRRLAAGSFFRSRPVCIWEVVSGSEMGSVAGHDSVTLALAVSPDSRVIATGSDEGTVGLWDLATGKELRKLKGHQGPVLAIAFSADGRRLISGSQDTTTLIWDIADLLPTPSSAPLQLAEMKELWVTLASPDGAAALRAVRRLALAPGQAVPYLKEHLGQVPTLRADRLARLLADLDADSFARREAASIELAGLGKLAEPGLKRLLENKPAPEARRRAEALLKELEGRQVSPAVLQAVRALEVLELIATPEARQVITSLAEGSAEARVGEEARAALGRLARR